MALAKYYRLNSNQVFVGVGSDDVLAIAFMTFFNSDKEILFPDITYSFYDVWADLYKIPYRMVELNDDFISRIGFNVMMFKGVQTYILRYEDVMLTATFSEDETFIGYAVINSLHYDTENDKAVVDVIEGIRPLVYVHELQALLRVYGYREFADGIEK